MAIPNPNVIGYQDSGYTPEDLIRMYQQKSNQAAANKPNSGSIFDIGTGLANGISNYQNTQKAAQGLLGNQGMTNAALSGLAGGGGPATLGSLLKAGLPADGGWTTTGDAASASPYFSGTTPNIDFMSS